MLPRWQGLAVTDKDFEVAYHAYTNGMRFPRARMEARPDQYFGFEKTPFADWAKDEITVLDFDVEPYHHLQYKP